MSVIERARPQDLMTLWPDDVGWPQDIGALAVLDGSGLLDAEGGFRLEPVRALIEGRLHLVPRFRQVLDTPRWGLGRPVWVDSPVFDVGDHVGLAPLSGQGDEDELLTMVEQLRRRPLDRSRPLWELWFLPGLAGGRTGRPVHEGAPRHGRRPGCGCAARGTARQRPGTGPAVAAHVGATTGAVGTGAAG
jgi:diacylglycerol O-acyltransferase